VVSKGLKAVSEPLAVVVEAGEDDGETELKRQTRIMAQSWHVCLRHLRRLFRKRQYGFLWHVASHKILRWISFPIFAVLVFTAFFGLFDFFPTLSMICSIIFATLAWFGSRGMNGISMAAWMFVMLHWASVIGLYRFCRGEMYMTWNPRQG
jgi:hypothetical protein